MNQAICFTSLIGITDSLICCYFTMSINVPKLSILPYFTFEVDICSKSFSAQLILLFSISRKSMLDMEPFVSATK